MKLIRGIEPASLPSTVSPFIKEIITNLLSKDPESRPDAEELLNKSKIRKYINKIITKVSNFDHKAGLILRE